MEDQPTGAGGHKLGAIAVVRLQVTTIDRDKHHLVACYVLESSKQIWNGELKNCAMHMVMGTNALEDLGFCIITNEGAKVIPEGVTEPSEQFNATNESKPIVAEHSKLNEKHPSQVKLILEKELHLGSNQAKLARVKVNGNPKAIQGEVLVVTLHEGILAEKLCDFMVELWVGGTTPTLSLTNWGHFPVIIEKDTVIGMVEEASLVTQDDPLWSEPVQLADPIVCLCHISGDELRARHHQLKEQLQIGECSNEHKQALLQMLYSKHQVFALSDTELDETNLVEHSIETADIQPVKVSACRLPYALRTELEAELTKLLKTGCIEASSSAYASGLVLVRKKDGGLRVCDNYRMLNKKTVPDRYPIPWIDEMIDTIGRQKGKVFT